jgi:hypothetical protein
VLRLGDFPEEALYTLLIGSADMGALDDWPAHWWRPG